MAKDNNNTLLILGALGVGAYLVLNNSGSNPVSNLLTTATNVANTASSAVQTTTYPYLVAGAPALPNVFNQAYYAQYIRPAMVAANPNVNNPGYVLNQTDATNYMANYTDVQEWANSPSVLAENQTGHSVLGACQYHWHTYGVPDQRTFLPLPWNDPAVWIPPPVNPKSSGSGSTLKTIATVASVAAMFIGPNDVLNDTEINLLVTSAAITKKILPFYLQVAPDLVASINSKLDSLISQYAD